MPAEKQSKTLKNQEKAQELDLPSTTDVGVLGGTDSGRIGYQSVYDKPIDALHHPSERLS